MQADLDFRSSHMVKDTFVGTPTYIKIVSLLQNQHTLERGS